MVIGYRLLNVTDSAVAMRQQSLFCWDPYAPSLILFLVDTDQVAKSPFSDKISEIFDNLTEDELWSKLEQERLESNDVERISDAWAKLEVGIIEDETK